MRADGDAQHPRRQDLRFAYRLVGVGWGEATVSQGEREATIAVSYLSDALGDLTTAVVALLGGAEEQTVRWLAEPGEYRWHFAREGARVRVRLMWVPEHEVRRTAPREEEIFVASCALARLAAQVRGALRQLLAEHGTDGYLARWRNHPFPMEDFQRLVEATRG